MRRFFLCMLIVFSAADVFVQVSPATAQLAFLFGARGRRRLYPARVRPRRGPSRPVADVPLPIPRPSFAAEAPVPAPEKAPVPGSAPPPAAVPAQTAISPAPAPPPPAEPQAVAGEPPLPPPRPADLAAPAVAPSGAKLDDAPGQPAADASCPGRLKARSVDLESVVVGAQPDSRCTVVDAVRLAGLTLPDGGKVDFPDRPTIACATADAFSLYVRDLLVPLAKGTYGAPVAAVWTGPGLECRSRDHIVGAKLSAHGQGLAIDIAQVRLSTGRTIEVGTPASEADQSFETASRAAGCGYFHTVLGPGSDSYHRNHWHFDLEVRGAKGDSKYCK